MIFPSSWKLLIYSLINLLVVQEALLSEIEDEELKVIFVNEEWWLYFCLLELPALDSWFQLTFEMLAREERFLIYF